MKPGSIVQFERLFLGSLAVRIISDAVAFSGSLRALKANPLTAAYGPGPMFAGMAVIYVALIALWYFAARRRSVVAKWIIAAWFVIAFCAMALGLFKGAFGIDLITVLTWAVFLLFGWATSYLFKPDADAWFSKKPSA